MNDYISIKTLRPILEAVFGAINAGGASVPSFLRGTLGAGDLGKDKYDDTFSPNPFGVWGVSYDKEFIMERVREGLEITDFSDPYMQYILSVITSDFAGVLLSVSAGKQKVTQLLVGSFFSNGDNLEYYGLEETLSREPSDINLLVRTVDLDYSEGAECRSTNVGQWKGLNIYDSVKGEFKFGTGQQGGDSAKTWTGTQTEYDALTPEGDTLYFITE